MADAKVRRLLVIVLAHAIRPYVDSDRGPTWGALELARNAAVVLMTEPEIDPRAVLDELLRHRMRNGWLTCGDVRSAAKLGADAWSRCVARRRPAWREAA